MFEKIKNAILEYAKNEKEQAENVLNGQKEPENFYLGRYLTSNMKRKISEYKESGTAIPEKEKQRFMKYAFSKIDKESNEYIVEVEKAEKAEVPERFTFSVCWYHNRTWGNCPRTETWGSEYHETGATGWGYDKESASINTALREDQGFKKLFYAFCENTPTQNRGYCFNGEYFGKPYFSFSGAGVSVLASFFEKAGYKWEHVAWGKTYDHYVATKVK